MTTVKETQERGLQPRALIMTIYGVYGRKPDGFSVASLIKLMAALGVDENAVRSSISRLKRRGVLEARRFGSAAGYALSAKGKEMYAEGDKRIFDRPRARLKDGWVLAVFSVPEAERDKRHAIRTRLTWLGYGTVSPGVWIAPAHLEEETIEVLERHGLKDYVHIFRAQYRGFSLEPLEIGSWWDLDELERLYDDFCLTYRPVLRRWQRLRAPRDEEAFAAYMRALTEWRRLPFLDPGLPPELLPPDFNGARAEELFERLQNVLRNAAARHVASVAPA